MTDRLAAKSWRIERRVMNTLIWRELTTVSRTGAFWAAIAAHVALLGAFVLTWSDRVPILDGTFFDQLMAVQTSLLAVVLPWVAVRCSAADQATHMVLLAATTAARPSRVVAARCAGLSLALSVLAASGAPLAILAQQVSMVPPARVPAEMLSSVALATSVAAASTAGILMRIDRFVLWPVVTAATAAALLALPRAAITPLFLCLGLTIPLALSLRADSTLRYLRGGDVA